MSDGIVKEDLERITEIQVSKKNLSKSQKYAAYKAIKRCIIENKIPPEKYYITKHRSTKDIQIDSDCLTSEILIEILCIADYK
jgi:fructose/tagatose bisphosphate aldolase